MVFVIKIKQTPNFVDKDPTYLDISVRKGYLPVEFTKDLNRAKAFNRKSDASYFLNRLKEWSFLIKTGQYTLEDRKKDFYLEIEEVKLGSKDSIEINLNILSLDSIILTLTKISTEFQSLINNLEKVRKSYKQNGDNQ